MTGVLGSALGAWWWSRHRGTAARIRSHAPERGTVIFDNTPHAADEGAL
jgi:hypothetical protein